MKVYFDAQSIHSWLDKDVIGGMQAKEFVARRESGDSWKESGEEDSSGESSGGQVRRNGELISRGFGIPACPLPLPFESIDGEAARVGDRYTLFVDVNDAKPRPLISQAGIVLPTNAKEFDCFSSQELVKLEEFYNEISDKISVKRPEYLRLNNHGLNGYLVERVRPDKCRSVLCVRRVPMTREHIGFTRFRIGGNGISQRTYGSEIDFAADLDYLSRFVTEVVNLGIEEAVAARRREANPQLDRLELRLGAPI